MPVCFCVGNSTLSRNMADGSRNNPADVHRTSRTSLQFHHNNRHNVPHPTPKHTDKSQHRTPHHNPRTQNSLGTTFHIQYRSIQTKVNTVSHTTTQELLKKARGVCRGAVALRPLCGFSTASQSKKTRPSAKKIKTKPKPNHTINKEKE